MKKILPLFLCLFLFQSANANWTKQNSGTLAWLHSIYFLDAQNGWIVGSNGTLLKTSDGGANWKQAKKLSDDNIRDVYFSDAQNGWILCERDVFSGDANSPSYILKTSDGGANWEKVTVIDEGKERVVKIFFSRDGSGYAVGEAGTLWTTTDKKNVWKKVVLPVRYLMLAGKFMDDFHAAIVGGGGTILFTEDHGLTWNPATIDGKNSAKLNSIFCINQKVGWTVGGAGKVFLTYNGGKFWHEQKSNVTVNLADIFFINTAEGWAVGDDGTILHTTTAGNVWNVEDTASNRKLERIFFVADKGFAVGFGGTIMNYNRRQTEEPPRAKPQLQRRATA